MITDIEIAKHIQQCYTRPNIESHGVECRIALENENQVLAIRGTTDIHDWIRNLKVWPIPVYKIGIVHAGFYLGSRLALKEIIRWLDIEKPVYIGGHSKGGPESIIIAKLLQLRGFKIEHVVTFGAPEFINQYSVKSLSDLNIKQYRNGGDLVPLLPSKIIKLLGHARELIQLGDENAKIGWENYHGIEYYIDALTK